ncbi:MAG: 2OG-Fe(II) oxygenase [Pseudomonadota bacterium]
MKIKPTFHGLQAFTIPGFLSPDECLRLIELSEKCGFVAADVRTSDGQKAMPTVRNNERVLVESQEWVRLLWERLDQFAIPDIDGQSPFGLPRELRFYKYRQGQRFKMHKDGPWLENGMTSKLTFLVYLNEEFAGGETDFKIFTVKPVTGMALLFIHATWHEGAAISEGLKYVLRSDVLYGNQANGDLRI